MVFTLCSGCQALLSVKDILRMMVDLTQEEMKHLQKGIEDRSRHYKEVRIDHTSAQVYTLISDYSSTSARATGSENCRA